MPCSVVKEFYCHSCGKFIRQLVGDPQDTQPVILTVYEMCPRCAFDLFKKAEIAKEVRDEKNPLS